VVNIDGSKPIRTLDQLKREQGPNLVGFGNKTSKVWIYEWLKDPSRYHPKTRMPNLRLTDQEAADIAAYLAQDTNTEFNKKSIPAVDESVLNEIVLQFLKKSASQDEAEDKLSKMKQNEKLHFAGQKLIAQYGCYSCHDIKGFSGFKPIGTDLSEQGSKTLDKLAFGFVHIEHSKEAWYNQKLRDPRIFDTKTIKAPDEKFHQRRGGSDNDGHPWFGQG
jgi:cytochrome c2